MRQSRCASGADEYHTPPGGKHGCAIVFHFRERDSKCPALVPCRCLCWCLQPWSFVCGCTCLCRPFAKDFAGGDHLVVSPAATVTDPTLHESATGAGWSSVQLTDFGQWECRPSTTMHTGTAPTCEHLPCAHTARLCHLQTPAPFGGSVSARHLFFIIPHSCTFLPPPHQTIWSTFSPCLRIWPILCTHFMTMARVVVGSGGSDILCC